MCPYESVNGYNKLINIYSSLYNSKCSNEDYKQALVAWDNLTVTDYSTSIIYFITRFVRDAFLKHIDKYLYKNIQ